MTTDTQNSRNLIRYRLDENTSVTLDNDVGGIGTHLDVDTANKVVYWIHFTAETTYKIYKTTYEGNTTQIGADQTGSTTSVDIASGNGYFYILDTTTSQINKYNKTTDTLVPVSTISLSPGAKRLIVLAGKLWLLTFRTAVCLIHDLLTFIDFFDTSSRYKPRDLSEIKLRLRYTNGVTLQLN